MRASQLLIATLKETPADAEIISHQLMLRAGLVRKLASGLYTWLPVGLRILRKVEQIVREEMLRAGAQEVLMPMVQPAELWQESGRWAQYGDELLRLQDRHKRDFCLGPTHEEVITDLIRNDVRSYKSLPANFFQIQTKFRDERRPRFGLMRAREFLMKDAYSFHTSVESLDETFDAMHTAYCRIFDRIGLEYRAVEADSGSIGGSSSREFHVLADSGEDLIAFSSESDYAANVELAEALSPASAACQPAEGKAEDAPGPIEVATPNVRSIEEVCQALNVAPRDTVKTLLVHGAAPGQLVALLLRGDHRLNEIKAEKLEEVASPLRMADEAALRSVAGCDAGSLGPLGLDIPVIADRAVAVMDELVCGANRTGFHLRHVRVGRDFQIGLTADLRSVEEGDPSPDGRGTLQLKRGIEVGHIFKLGTKYASAMSATVLDEQGKARIMEMGCYGIGVSRIVAAAIEQNHDDRGIIWPLAIAPFTLAIVPLNGHKSEVVQKTAEALYHSWQQQGVDVLLDDRQERPGVKFADLELMGIPHRIVVSERGLQNSEIEYRGRQDEAARQIPQAELESFLIELLREAPRVTPLLSS